MRYGATNQALPPRSRGLFRRSVENAEQGVMPKAYKVMSIFCAVVAAMDVGKFVPDGVTISTVMGIVFGGVCVLGCRPSRVRQQNTFTLKRLYAIRIYMSLCFASTMSAFMLASHRFLARVDSGFVLNRDVLVMAASIGLLIAAGIFLVDIRLLRRVSTQITDYAQRTEQPGTIDDLDRACPVKPIPHINMAMGTAAAVFGAFVLPKTQAFPFVFMAVELMLFTFFLNGTISLTYESILVLRNKKNRSLVLLRDESTRLQLDQARS